MSNISNRMHNPTNFDIEINWHQGIDIVIPADGFTDLTIQQLDDFRDGKAGSEAVRETMDHFGLFLEDADRTYEAQALEAIRKSIRAKESMHKGVVANLRKSRLSEGLNDTAEVFDELLDSVGQLKLRDEIVALKRREKKLAKYVEESDAEKPVHEQLDPEKTVFFEDGTFKVFASKVSLEIYLGEPGREALKSSHALFLAAQRGTDDEPDTVREV